MHFKTLSSINNPVIKEALHIKARKTPGVFLLEGPRLIETAYEAGAEIRRIFFETGLEKKPLIRNLLKKIQAETFEVTEAIINKLSETESPQGIIAIVLFQAKKLEDIRFKDPALLAVSDGISEPGNLGSIVRTADAVGADAAIVLQGSVDAFSPKAIRASHGSVFHIPILKAEKEDFIFWAKRNGIKIAILHPKAETSIFEADLRVPLALVFGNEASGISNELKNASDIALKIPMPGKAESLNVGHSAAVCLYEALRQRILQH